MVLSEEQQQLGNNASGSALTTQFQPSNFNGSTAPHTTCFEPILRVENASSNIISSQSMSTPSRPLPIANSISQSVQAVMDGNMPTYNHLQPTLTAPFLPPPPLPQCPHLKAQQLPQHQFQTYHQYQQRFLNYPKYEYYEEDQQHHPSTTIISDHTSMIPINPTCLCLLLILS
uniref:Uncharacterized protein n=1 Tax=Ditylenchus dipsaci TaxID=166011 RepID=A0A915CZ31_9BILA